MLVFLLPLLVPPITYGIPLATVLYQAGLAGTLWGVVLANLVPSVPFVVLVMIPFIEQIDPASSGRPGLRRRHAPALPAGAPAAADPRHPGRPAPGAGAHHAMFELTFLVAGPTSQTLVVALYYAVFAAGVRAGSRSTRWRWSTWR